jgi:hypothetical protein
VSPADLERAWSQFDERLGLTDGQQRGVDLRRRDSDQLEGNSGP